MRSLLILGGKVVTSHRVGPAAIYVEGESVARVGKGGLFPSETFNAKGLLVFPGVVDAHVHFALPVAGTRSADDFRSGSLAAAAGGVTTFIDFTVGHPAIPLPEALERRLKEARVSAVDYSFHVEMVGWESHRLEEIAAVGELGVRSFKFYLAYSESGRRTSLGVLRSAMEAIAKIGGVAMVHAEADELVDPKGGPFPWARPAVSEEVAIASVGILARETRCPTYIAHISSGQGLAALLAARRAKAPLMGETCPHYLLLDERVYSRPDGHLFSVTPPLRTPVDQKALWRALARRELQAVATDHCPFTRAQKDPYREEPQKLPSGLPGVETLFILLFSAGVGEGRLRPSDLAWHLAEGPARAFGLWPKKGGIQPGSDADLVFLDPKATWTIHAEDLHMATDFSPYEGFSVRGKVVGVLSRGEWVYRDGEILAKPGRGKFVAWQG
ncbi:MAG: amidohydrolase family protein [Candidatus Bipolaricaulaceae bacterium]